MSLLEMMATNLENLRVAAVSEHVKNYVQEAVDQKLKTVLKEHGDFESFKNEDVTSSELAIAELKNHLIDDYVRKDGSLLSGQLTLPLAPNADFDVVNKQYVDYVFQNAVQKNRDIDLNHYKISNVQDPVFHSDAATKHYVDQLFKGHREPCNCIFSKGCVNLKKTTFFTPGFVVPYDMKIVSVGFSTSFEKLKPIDKLKTTRNVSPSKLYFVIDGEVQSEHFVVKEFCEGYVLKEFEAAAAFHPKPIVFEKGTNLTMMVDAPLEESSASVTFCRAD